MKALKMYFMTTKSLDDAVSVTASEAVASFPVTKLLDPLGSGKWRSVGTTPNIVVEFSSPQLIDAWGFWYHNGVAGDTVRLRQADTLGGLTSAPDKDITVSLMPGSGADFSSYEFIHQRSLVTNPETRLFARVDLSTTTFFEAGALFLTQRLQLARGVDFGFQLKPSIRALHNVALSGGGTGRGAGVFKQDAELSFAHMSRSELGEFLPLLRDRRGVQPTAGVVRSDASVDLYPMDYMFFGYLDPTAVVFNELDHSIVVPFTEP